MSTKKAKDSADKLISNAKELQQNRLLRSQMFCTQSLIALANTHPHAFDQEVEMFFKAICLAIAELRGEDMVFALEKSKLLLRLLLELREKPCEVCIL